MQLVCSLAVLGHKDAITDVFLGAVSDEAVRCIGNIVWAAASVGHGSMIEAELMETVIRRMVLLEMHKVSLSDILISKRVSSIPVATEYVRCCILKLSKAQGAPFRYVHVQSMILQLQSPDTHIEC